MTVAELKGLLSLYEDDTEVRIIDGDWDVRIDDVDLRNGIVIIQSVEGYE